MELSISTLQYQLLSIIKPGNFDHLEQINWSILREPPLNETSYLYANLGENITKASSMGLNLIPHMPAVNLSLLVSILG